MAYVVVKNGTTVIPHSLNKYTWKYLDECQEFAAQQCQPGNVIEICELTPKFVYKLELNAEEVPGHVCSPAAPEEQQPSHDGSEEPSGPAPEEPSQEEDENKNEEPPAGDGEEKNEEPSEGNKPGLPITDLTSEEE